MKPTILFSLLLLTLRPAFGQGFITWGNNPTGFRAPIYGPLLGTDTLSTTGQSGLGTPPGST